MKTKDKTNFGKPPKKRKINKNIKRFVLFYALATILLVFTLILLIFHPDCTKNSEKNTYEVSGTVTAFEYVPPGFNPFSRIPTTIRCHLIHLDNGKTYKVAPSNYERVYDDPQCERLRSELVGKYVTLRLSNFKKDRIVTINTDEKCYLSFEDSNKQHILAVIVLPIVDIFILFIMDFLILDSYFANPRYSRLRRRKKRKHKAHK